MATPQLPPNAASTDGDAPPLGLVFSAIALVAFMLVLIFQGFTALSAGRPAIGLPLVVIGAALCVNGWRLYRCSFVAWLIAMAVFALMLALTVVAAVVLGSVAPLLYAPVFVAPMLLLGQPSARAALRQGG
jgi:hypothetical protein